MSHGGTPVSFKEAERVYDRASPYPPVVVAIEPLHGGAEMQLPLALDTARFVLATGALVLGLVLYDAYRTYWG